MFSGPSHSHCKHIDGASTLPRAKSKTYGSPAWSAKPSICIPPAQKPDCPSTLSARSLKLSDSLHLPGSEPTDPRPTLDSLPLRVSSTLLVPTIRLSPSPTSLCQGTNLDGSETRQPSPVARERRARLISTLTTNIQPTDVLETVRDATHSAPRGDCSVTFTESNRQAAGTQNSFVLSKKVDLIKNEQSNSDESKTPPRKIGIPAIRQSNLNSKKHLEFLPNAATNTQTSEPKDITNFQRKSRLAFDARPNNEGKNLHRKHVTAHTSGSGSKEPLAKGRNADLPAAPGVSDLIESTVVHTVRQFNCNTVGNKDAALLSGSNLNRPWDENVKVISTELSSGPYHLCGAAQNKTSPQKHRLRENTNTHMNIRSTLIQSSNTMKDCCFRPKLVACQDLNDSTGKLNPQCSDQCSSSQTKCSKSSITTCINPGQNKSHATKKLSDMGLNQTAEGPAELPECSPQSCVKNWPLSVEQRSRSPNGLGNKTNGVFDILVPPQRRVYQRAANTTPMASALLNQPKYAFHERAIFLEEDPYYVTMYHHGSVYVGE